MGRAKSVLVSMAFTVAGNSHNCKFNETHRIPKGANRLTIKEDGNSLHYCLACARGFLDKGAERLQLLRDELLRLSHQ